MSRINPLHLILSLLALVLVINAAFIYVALQTREPVVASYDSEAR